MTALERLARRTLFIPVAAVRPYLVLKATLLLLAFDVWLTRASYGYRYGMGGFNVAHFAWLDAIQPDVSPAIYVAVVTLTGLLGVVLALAPRAPRWLIGITFLLHTWSWAMSMLDSYQHHYLLSIVLLALAFFPRLTAEEALLAPSATAPEPAPPKKRGKRDAKKPTAPAKPSARADRPLLAAVPTVPAWAYVALSASIAIVYAYTAYAKTADEWLTGAALQRVLGLGPGGVVRANGVDRIAAFRELAGALGLRGETFWWFMGHSVVLVQMICAAGYLLAPFRDVARSLPLRIFFGVALATALSFHFGAEYMELKIGWFSGYMILYAAVFFLPGRWLAVLARLALPISRSLGSEVLLMRIGVGLGLLILSFVAPMIAAAPSSPGLVDIVIGFSANLLGGWAVRSIAILLLVVTPLRMLLQAVRETDDRVSLPTALAAAGVGVVALIVVGVSVDLPGAQEAGILAAAALALGVVALLVVRGHTRAIHPYGVGAALGALALFASMALSDVRYDFYRKMGGDHRRRGELLTAYHAYVKANRYAPEGQNRAEREEELRRTLIQRGELPPGE